LTLGSELNNVQSMICLANWYDIHNNHYKTIKYLKQVIKYNDKRAMNWLGCVYYVKKDYENAINYYKMAIQYKNYVACYSLANYYKNIEHNIEKMLYYYKLGTKNKYVRKKCLCILSQYYASIKQYKNAINYLLMIDCDKVIIYKLGKLYYKLKDYENAIKYFTMGIENNCYLCMKLLGDYYRKIEYNYHKALKYYTMCKQINYTIGVKSLIVLHLYQLLHIH